MHPSRQARSLQAYRLDPFAKGAELFMSIPRIPLSEPYLTGNAQRYLNDCVTTNFVSSVGPFVDRFEREFAAYLNAKHAVACSSGTAALHVALRLAGVETGDEVFVSSFTFIASVNPIVYQGATPVLVDSENATWNLDPGLVVEEIERRVNCGARLPKAVEVVHVLGHPADIAELERTCARHGITIVEDAAEALGARYLTDAGDGPHVGTVGRIGCFSFNGNKIITTGGGGMLVTDDAELARRAKHLTTQARLPGRAYIHDEVGYNYRLTNLAAALGVAQLEELDPFLESKRGIASRYDAAFGAHPAITLPPRVPFARSSHWLYSILLDPTIDRDAVVERLIATGIDARPLWMPVHRMAPYRTAPLLGSGAVAEAIAAQGLSLPSSVQLGYADQERVVEAVIAAVERASCR